MAQYKTMFKSNLIIYVVLSVIFFGCLEQNIEPEKVSLIPMPNDHTLNEGKFVLDSQIGIKYPDDLKISAEFLNSFIENGSSIKLQESNEIEFILDTTVQNSEGYNLEILPNKIKIKAKSDKGAFYAVQTIRQLLPKEFENGRYDKSKAALPCLSIKDEPQFEYRGMHLDVGRHMYSVNFIKKYIDALAMLKFNTFHWHLTEDQGWRIEIKKYPKLQQIAAYRKETLVGHYNQQPHQFDGKPYGGYYTHEQIKEIVAYAQGRFVTIIPEIEMPGHSQAAIAAYPHLGCSNKPVDVATKWGVFDEIYCPTEETFKFLEDVLDEVMLLFPSKYIHIGGDEAPKTKWKSSAFCQNLIIEKGLKDEHELQSYFIRRIEKYLNSKGREIIGWDEILEGGLAPNATVMSWRGTNGAIEAAKQKHDVVMTPTSHCYFDYYQSQNEDEPLAIGGFLPLEKVYGFSPIPEELSKETSQYIIGVQGNVWTEYMPNEKQVEYMLFPRIMAMSEVGWSNSEKKDFKEFVNRVEYFNKRLDLLDINYANHLYDIEGQIVTQNDSLYLELSTLTKDNMIRYTRDGRSPNKNSEIYYSKIPLTESVEIQAAVFDSLHQRGYGFFQKFKRHKAVGQNIVINRKPHHAYSGSGSQGLINGINGSNTRFGDKEWLGFWGEDLEVTIQFKQPTEINAIQTRFYDAPGQWVYSPREFVAHAYLQDGSLISSKFFPEEKSNSNVRTTFCKLNESMPVIATKVKLIIPNFGIIPEGSQGKGNPAWTFLDEIVIE